MADQATPHRRRVPLKAARDITDKPAKAKSKGKAAAKTKHKTKSKAKQPPAIEAAEVAAVEGVEGVEAVEAVEVAAVEAPDEAPDEAAAKPKPGWRRLKIRWGVVLVVGPVLVVTPIILTWSLLAIFSPVASYFAALVKSVREDRAWSVLGGLSLGAVTVGGLVVIVLATLEGMTRRRARTGASDESKTATMFALTATAGTAVVCTPLALFFGSGWLSARAESGTDIATLFTELDASRSTMRTWVILGIILMTGAATWAAKNGKLEPVKTRTAKAFDEWAEAKFDFEKNPDRW